MEKLWKAFATDLHNNPKQINALRHSKEGSQHLYHRPLRPAGISGVGISKDQKFEHKSNEKMSVRHTIMNI